MYKSGVVASENRVAQYENLALWLARDGDSPWLWVIPDDVQVRTEKGVTFLACDRTWVAIRPLGANEVRVDDGLTRRLADAPKSRFPGHKVLSTRGTGGSFCGLAIEVGERQSHRSFDEFRKAVRSAEVDLADLHTGAARYKASDGKWLGIHWNDNPLDLGVWRNGQRRDLEHAALFASPVIAAAWGLGTLEVQTDGARFRCYVDEEGRARFE
jgi:hypothetical protein